MIRPTATVTVALLLAGCSGWDALEGKPSASQENAERRTALITPPAAAVPTPDPVCRRDENGVLSCEGDTP
jgi:hypothetical protein